MEKKVMSHFTAGMLLGIIGIVFFLVYYFMGLSFKEGIVRWLPNLVTIGLIVFLIIKWAKDNDHNVTFGACFGYGFKSVAIAALISVAFVVVFIIIFPEFKQQFVDVMREQMDKQPNSANIPEEQKEQSISLMSRFFYAIIIGGGLLGNLFIGAIGSLLGAAVAKKNPSQNPF